MEEWQERVIEERQELGVKLNKLTCFLGRLYDQLPLSVEQDKAVDLLQRQQNIMVDYHNILTERISAFREKK